MNAQELEKKVTELAGELKGEDRVLGTRLDALEDQGVAGTEAHKDLERRVDDLRNDITALKQQVAQLRADGDRWRAYLWTVIAAAFSITFGAVVTAIITISLALAGFKKPS